MGNFGDTNLMELIRRPAVVLAIALLGCAVLLCLPERLRGPIKGRAADWLRPAQQAVLQARSAGRRLGEGLDRHFRASADADRLESELARLAEENRRLAAELSALRLAVDAPPGALAAGSLLRPRPVEARVLGRQALAWLGRAQMLDVGRSAGAENGTLVLAPSPVVLDCGHDRSVKPGHLVLGENCVWGRIAEVGRYTSLVRGLLDPGYRDVVQIVGQKAAARGARHGPPGVLEGTGGPRAKISRVEVTEPVEVGDLVFTAAESGLLARPVLYGQVARVERPVGSACWDIWMEPAAGNRVPDRLLVLTAELNSARTAASPVRQQETKK